MTQRTPGEEDSAQGARKAPGRGFGLAFGMSRTQQMGNRGLAAASIGWTLAGCIILGFVAGSWLDRRFGTQYWTPILFLIGVAAGFREMFRTLEQLNAANKAERDKAKNARAAMPSPTQSDVTERARAAGEAGEVPQVLAAPAETRQRLFSVPPPPFMEQPGEIKPQMSAEEVKRRLLGEPGSGDSEEGGKRDAV